MSHYDPEPLDTLLSAEAFAELMAIPPAERSIAMLWAVAGALGETRAADLADQVAGVAFTVAHRMQQEEPPIAELVRMARETRAARPGR